MPSDHLPVLFFNGIGASIELATPFLELLPQRDVVTFDVPGIGTSPPAHWPYRPRDIARAADAILRELGYAGEVDVMGVSWGGMIAQQFAHQFAARTKSLVLAATTAGLVMVPGRLSAMKEMIHPRRHVRRDWMAEHKDKIYGGKTAGLASIWSQTLAPSRRGYLHQLLALWGWTSAWFLRFLEAPTLILAGEDDRLIPLANARLLQWMIPDARLRTIPDGGHMFLLTHREEMADEVERFLARARGVTKLTLAG
jgi:poly(3-hydroxyalkanoate) depolymerase